MENIKKISYVLAALALAVSTFLFSAGNVHAAVSSWQKGVIFNPNSTTDYSSDAFKQSLSQAAAMHANYVTLVIPVYQSNVGSTDVNWGWNTPTDQSLVDGISYAHSLGMGVMLKMHDNSYDGQWSANINPGDRTTWFTNYSNILKHFGLIAQQNHVEEFCIGNELIDMSTYTSNGTNTQNWINMINMMRGIYSGKLTYGANWGGCDFCNEKAHIGFWGSLDEIGLSAYFDLGNDLQASWTSWNNTDIQPLQQQYGKPVLFTEIGYRSVTGAHTAPWDYNLSGPADEQEQANDYSALFSFWNNYGYMTGINIWYWEMNTNAGGAGTTSYTPQNKLAQGIISNWFGQGNSGGPSPSPSPATFSTSGAGQQSVNNGQQATLTAHVTDTSSNSAQVLVDAEIYNSSGQKVYQTTFPNQNFNAGQSQDLNFNWTPSTQGAYRLKIGVFSNDWSKLYVWNDDALQINVGSSGSNPPPQTGSIDVWWPTNGSQVSGSQPLKAMMPNYDVSAYDMYWQVDGGQLNLMPNNYTDYPHKEVQIDFSGWNWRGSGPYVITLLSKNSNNVIIAKQSLNIYVIH